MSHDYHIRCSRCDEKSGDVRESLRDELFKMIEHSYPIWLAHKAGWDVWNMVRGDLPMGDIPSFIVKHWECGALGVQGEYSNDPFIPFRPAVPNYEALILPKLLQDMNKAIIHLSNVIAKAQQ
jgi:hypothetical protein